MIDVAAQCSKSDTIPTVIDGSKKGEFFAFVPKNPKSRRYFVYFTQHIDYNISKGNKITLSQEVYKYI